MKTNVLFRIIFIAGVFLLTFMSPVIGQTQKSKRQKQDTTKLKDPMNRMDDSSKMREMMRDSNILIDPHKMTKDSMPVKKGWMNTDSTRKKSTRI